MPFFLHFRPDFLIETLPGCVDAEHPNLYPEPLSSHEFLLAAAARNQPGVSRVTDA